MSAVASMPINLIRGETFFKIRAPMTNILCRTSMFPLPFSKVFEGMRRPARFPDMHYQSTLLLRLGRFGLLLALIGFVQSCLYLCANLSCACCWGPAMVYNNLSLGLMPLLLGLAMFLFGTSHHIVAHLTRSRWRAGLLLLLACALILGGVFGPRRVTGVLLVLPMLATFILMLRVAPGWSRTRRSRAELLAPFRQCAYFTLGFAVLLSLRAALVLLDSLAFGDVYFNTMQAPFFPLMAGLLVFASSLFVGTGSRCPWIAD